MAEQNTPQANENDDKKLKAGPRVEALTVPTAQTSFTHGKSSVVMIGSTPLFVTKLDVDQKYITHDVTTTSNTNGIISEEYGLKQANISGEGLVDATTDATPFTLIQNGTKLALTAAVTSASQTFTGNVLIDDCKVTIDKGDMCKYTFTGKTSGNYTLI